MNVRISKRTIAEWGLYALALAAGYGLYRALFLLSSTYLTDGRFISNLTLGMVSLGVSVGFVYVLFRYVVFRGCLKQEGNLSRFSLTVLVAALLYVCLLWILQDVIGAAVGVSELVAGIVVCVACWPVLHFKVLSSQSRRSHKALHIASHIFLMLLVAAGVCFLNILCIAVEYIYMGPYLSQADTTSTTQTAAADELGRLTVHADLEAFGIATDGSAAGIDFVWDDDWFFQDSYSYNSELALACAIFANFANSESDAYVGDTSTMTATELLLQLGFEDIRTASYEYHSTIIDNLATLSTGATDTVAYVIAAKHITSSSGQTKTLVCVMVRGSYGSEWLSDFNIVGNTPEGYEDTHLGFAQASIIVDKDLRSILEEYADDELALLICGHSRGAAVTNLMAATYDEQAQAGEIVGLDPASIFAYSYASPGVTTKSSEVVSAELYSNIFNFLVPSDVVPRLPLEEWGYRRYGTDICLPREGDEGFEDAYEAMQAYYVRVFGMQSPGNPSDVDAIDKACERLAEALPSTQGLGSPESLLALAHMFTVDLNAAQVLASHYVPTYIAWIAVS